MAGNQGQHVQTEIDWKGEKKRIMEIVVQGLEHSPQLTAADMAEIIVQDLFPGAVHNSSGVARFITRYEEEVAGRVGEDALKKWRARAVPQGKKTAPTPSEEERTAAAFCPDFSTRRYVPAEHPNKVGRGGKIQART